VFRKSLKMLAVLWVIRAQVETLDHPNMPARGAGERR
jgi:hypothetical protein